jgi:large subunit ribosomal protein L22
MQVRAETKYARISAFKVREVAREIQGMPAIHALNVVRLIPKKAAKLISKTLASAIANAENNNNLRPASLVVFRAIAGEGPTFKRMHARARGSGSRINKRTAHIEIVLTDSMNELEEQKAAKKSASLARVKARKEREAAAVAAPESK